MGDQPNYAENEPTGIEPYDRLMSHFARMAALEELGEVASTDMNIYMPKGGGKARNFQLSTLNAHLHELLISDETRKNLEAAEARQNELSPLHQRNLDLMRRNFDLAVSLPSDLVREKSELAAHGAQMHEQWKKDGDFEQARPHLERLVELSRHEGEIYKELFGADSAYDGLLQVAQPGLGEAKVDSIFAALDAFLGEAIPEIREKQAKQQAPIVPDEIHDRAMYERANEEISVALGLDRERGVPLIYNGHPFSGGTPDDVRLTTVIYPDAPHQTVFATIHETGHATYDQGTPIYWRHQPLGKPLGMGVHESQSLFWENQMGHSYPFLQWLAPKLQDIFNKPADDPAWQADNLYQLTNQVQPNLIRVFADEVTYPLNVMIRHKLGKAMINGDMKVGDLPEAWHEEHRRKLGITPDHHGEGVLQDPHWFGGAFSYFHLYTIGALGAAQFNAALRENIPDLDMHLYGGDMMPALNWLRDNVHGQASTYDIDGLMEKATGRPLDSQSFKQHIRDRYLAPA